MTITVTAAGETATLEVATPAAPYRPVRVDSARDPRLHVPADARLVPWPYSTPAGGYLDDVFATLSANDILVLPEAAQPYQWDTAPGFRRSAIDTRHYFSMARFTRGIVGLGPGTVIAPSPSSFTAPPQPKPFIDPVDRTEKVGCQHKALETVTPAPYFGNLEMRGADFGGIAYNGVAFSKGIGRLENVFFNAAHRGFKNGPNGEAGAFTVKSGPVALARNFEIECRDATGRRVGSSPWMFNSLTGATVEDAYVHHALTGMATCWQVNGPIRYTRVRSEYNGSGSGGLSGHAFNFELCTDVAEITDSTIICNWHGNTTADGTSNVGLHIGGGSDKAKLRVNLRNVTVDKGPANGVPAVQLFGYTPQYGLDVHRYDQAGTELPVRVYGTANA